MTDAPPPTDAADQGPDWADAAEARVLDAATGLIGPGVRWDATLFARSAATAGLSTADAGLLMPQGARDLAALLWRRHDTQALAALGRMDPSALKVRARIRTAVLARLDAAMADEAAVRAASLYLGRPQQASLTLQLGWATADALWRWAGDTSTDENHYSKRALLCAILASTMAVRLARGEEAGARHLDARIENVMQFEKLKAKLPPLQEGLTVLAANLGRLRYRT
ncbi:COQ9 family protein [Caulobacter sp. S45]|uniref:COQ9 family protein n=1 Tax=Caulobacter sp. S45 TaxID=1641861 RepID=UPI001576A25E|nr:COQ9 family protein [Caulobacter sp. S45]